MTRPTTTEKLTGTQKRVGLWCVPVITPSLLDEANHRDPGHDFTATQANAIYPSEALI